MKKNQRRRLIFIALLLICGMLVWVGIGYYEHLQLKNGFVESLLQQLDYSKTKIGQEMEYIVCIPNQWNADAVLVCPSYGVPKKKDLVSIGVPPVVADKMDGGLTMTGLGPEGVSFYLIKGEDFIEIYSLQFVPIHTCDEKYIYSPVGDFIKLEVLSQGTYYIKSVK
jgi:hypothetical protein